MDWWSGDWKTISGSDQARALIILLSRDRHNMFEREMYLGLAASFLGS